MASTYTDLLRIEQQADGENSGTWGQKYNACLNMLEDAISGRASITHSDAASYTLTTANGTVDEARNMVLNIGGALSAARNTVVPTASKLYFAKNATTGGYATTVKTAAGTGISVPNGKTTPLICDGVNVVDAIDYLSALTIGGTLAINGGTLNVSPPAQFQVNGSGGAFFVRTNGQEAYFTAGATSFGNLANTALSLVTNNITQAVLQANGCFNHGIAQPVDVVTVSGAATTLFDASTYGGQSAYLFYADDSATTGVVGLLYRSGSGSNIVAKLAGAAGTTLSMSGNNVQITQTTGSGKTYSIRIAPKFGV